MRPHKSRGLREVGITAEGDNDALGGPFLAGWSVLHALARTPPAPRSQVGRMLGAEARRQSGARM